MKNRDETHIYQKDDVILEESEISSHEGPLIVFDHITKEYREGFVSLEDISLAIEEREFVCLVGSSGAGKSSLLRMLYAEDFPTSGEVLFGGRPTTAIKRRLLPYYRRNFGLVFQDFKLLPNRTAFENVAFALEVDGWKTEDIRQEIPGILAVVGLEGKADAYPHQLSGGENQRVSLARALVHRPRVIIADEPTGNLDHRAAAGIVDLLKKVNEMGATVILATHARDIVNSLDTRVITLERGKVIRDEIHGKYLI